MTADSISSASGRRVVVSGASGLVGREVVRRLEAAGDQPIHLIRRAPTSTVTEAQWSVDDGLANRSRLEGVHGVIHLAGENIADGRWTEAKKHRIRDSRVTGTSNLCRDLAALENKPEVLVCASAIGYYGDRGETELDEGSAPGEGFLPDVCTAWEAATAPAADAGIRVVNVRIGVVLSHKGGALTNMLLPFKMGVGGRIGDGKQYFSWVSHDDVVGALLKALNDDSLSGPLNATAPNPVTNAEFTKSLGTVLHRPTLFPLPAFAARMMLGQMADDLLLASARVLPHKLQTSGYTFAYPQLQQCLEHELGGN